MTVPYTIWDVETTIKTSYKRKGNPFDPDNYIVMSGYKYAGGPIVGDYFGRRAQGNVSVVGSKAKSDWFTKLLAPPPPYVRPKYIVGVNIKFDLLYALRDKDNHDAWMEYVAAGGLVWDCQLAEYLLAGMAQWSHMLSMDEMAPMYGGNTKNDEVKALWEAGVSTEEIDPDLLRLYLCGDETDHGDIGNTELIFLAQLAKAEASGQMQSIILNMGSLLCTIEMERNGMKVDKELGLKLAAELAEELATLTIKLNSFLPEDLPFDFKWGSRHHKSALIFGGTVKYDKWKAHADDEGNPIYAQKKITVVTGASGRTMELEKYQALVAGGAKDTAIRFANGKRAGEYKTKQVMVPDTDKPKGAIQPHYYTFPGMTEPSKRWATADPAVWSVSADVIKALANRGIPFLAELSKVEQLAKDLGTYYISTKPNGEEVGMLTLVQLTGIIHHMLNHTSTVTARFSSSNPNLQNLPKEGKSLAKSLFISRFPGGYIIQSDFTALEVYVQAILTLSKQLIKDLQLGLDMHCVRVSQKEGIPYEEALLKCKGDKSKGIDPIPEWDKKRTKAKIFSFQRAYGAGAALIAEETGMDIEEVKALINAESERYPEVDLYYAKLTQQIVDNSEPSGKFAAHPDAPHLTCAFRKSFVQTPDGKRYSYMESPAPEFLVKRPANRGGCITSFSPTEIKNYVVQGGGGEWAKAGMWLAVRTWYATKNMKGQSLLVNQVHDALYADSAKEVAVTSAAMLHACMEASSEYMEYLFDWRVPVPVPSETMMGANMMDEQPMYKFTENFPATVRRMRLRLRELYMDGYIPSFERNQHG